MFQLKNNFYDYSVSVDRISMESPDCAQIIPDSPDFQISFFHCTPEAEPMISVQESGRAFYTYFEHVAARITYWITVTALEFCREIVRIVSRCFGLLADCAAFNRNTFIREGELRL